MIETQKLLTLINVLYIVSLSSSKPCDKPQIVPGIVTREEWLAEPPSAVTPLATPAPLVVVHHSSVPPACFSREDCADAMRLMQRVHQVGNHWADIGYNFAVGSDGLVYEGRGWDRVGAHAQGINDRSIGIVLIGHWVSELPPRQQLEATQQLIAFGVRQGHIREAYSLVGHRQVRDTECPGAALYDEISRWPHFDDSVQYNPESI